MSAYLIWKTAHVISAAILFGTGLGIAFFAWFGYRRALVNGQIEGLRSVLRLTVVADSCFTAPAVVFQLASGLILMQLNAWPLLSSWSVATIGLFLFVGALWLPVVWIQILMNREAHHVASIKELSPRFHHRFLLWFVLGVPAFIAVIILFFLMIAKPLSITS